MKRLDSVGIILKKEKLASFESPAAIHELVLEDLSLFPGYYDQFQLPMGEKELLPRHLFFVVKGFDFFNDDEFIRKTARIRSMTGHEFDAVPGQIQVFNETYPCIRIRTYQSEIIPELVTAYKKEGVVFVREKTVKPYEGIIKIKTFFQIEEMKEGIYRHIRKPEVFFITIPYMPDWGSFEEITLSIRRNSDHKHYDAALAAAYARQGMLELIRIYDRSCSLDYLLDLRTKYNRELNREMHK